MSGYAGSIVRIDLTSQKISIIPTKKYEHWIGGHGMGSAIFFDLVKDKTIDGFLGVVALLVHFTSGDPRQNFNPLIHRLNRVDMELALLNCLDNILSHHQVFDIRGWDQHPLISSQASGLAL